MNVSRFIFWTRILAALSFGLTFQSSPYPHPAARSYHCRLFSSFAGAYADASNKVDISKKSPRDLATMDQWVANCGAQRAEGLQLMATSADGTDFGVMTTNDLPANTPVLFVPSSMILSGIQAQQEFGIVQGAEDLLVRLNEGDHLPHFYLLLKVLKEYEWGDQSSWYPWLNSVPRYYSNGASMTQYCSQCLPPLVSKLTSQERIRFSKFFQALKHVYFIGDKVKRNRGIAKWAFQVVYTRSFPTGYGDVCIAPMADMFNHGTTPEIHLSYDEQGNCYAHTAHDVPAGSELRMSYGDPTNPSYLFARYGFLDESSPSTFCKIMIENPTQQLLDLGYDHSRMLFYKDTGGVSPEVWDVLLYQILESDPSLQQAFYQAHMNGDSDSKQAYHQQYYPQTSAALMHHIDTFLSQLDVYSQKGAARIKKKATKHPRLPLIMQHNEFVRQTFLTVRAQL